MRSVISVVLSVFMIISYTPWVFAKVDYSGHFAKTDIEQLIERGTVLPSPNGEVRPDEFILRAEFVKIINKEFAFTVKAVDNFSDVGAEEWYAEEFLIAKGTGYLVGNGFEANPTVNITRAEAAVILARILELFQAGEPNFTDKGDIPKWALTAVNGLTNAGILRGYPNGAFLPNNKITRGEAFHLINNLPKTSTPVSYEPQLTSGNTGSMAAVGVSVGSGGGGGGGGGGSSAPQPNVVNISADTGMLYYGASPNVTSYQIVISYQGSSITKEFSISPSAGGAMDLSSAINTLLAGIMEPEAELSVSVAVKGASGGYGGAKVYTFTKTFAALDVPANFTYSYEYTAMQKNLVLSWASVSEASGYEVTVESGEDTSQTIISPSAGDIQTHTIEAFEAFEDGEFTIFIKALADPLISDKKHSKSLTQAYNKRGAFLEAGTFADPYIINAPVDLYNMTNPSGVYYIASDITISRPIETFSGKLEGRLNGEIGEKPTINLEISESDMGRVALFSSVLDGDISNLILDGYVVSNGANNDADVAAGLAGETFGTSNISEIINYASVTKSKTAVTGVSTGAGGIVGRAGSGSLSNCYNYGEITVTVATNSNVGGIVGYANIPVKKCINYGEVKGLAVVGGIVGITYSGISDCANFGTITAASTTSYVGGIAGTYASSTLSLELCYNAGVVAGNVNAGGIAGRCYPGTSAPAKIYNCFNIGNVNAAGAKSGGIMGSIDRGTVELSLCYDAQSNAKTSYNIVGDNISSATTGRVVADDETIFYLDDGQTHIGFSGTKISEKELRNLLNTKAQFNQNVWRVLPETGYPYPQLISNICDILIKTNVSISETAGDFGYTISWDEMPGTGDYKLYMSQNEAYTEDDLLSLALQSNSYFISYDDLVIGESYYLTVVREGIVSAPKHFEANPFTDLDVKASKRIAGTLFTWDEIPGDGLYKLYVSESSSFSVADLLIGTLANPTYTLPHGTLIEGNTYYIRVVKDGVISKTVAYTPSTAYDLDIKPARDESGYTLTWDEIPGPGYYKLYISSSGEFTEGDLVSDNISSPTYLLTFDMLPEERVYFIKVVKGDTESQAIEYAPYLYTSNTLKAVTIGGQPFDEFDPDVTSYRIVLPYGATEAPRITSEPTSSAATVNVTGADSLPGSTVITVTSESGEERLYTFNFAIVKKALGTAVRAGHSTGAARTIREITTNMSTFFQMRNYNNPLSSNTSIGFLRLELDESIPDGCEILSTELNAHFAQSADYVPIFSFHNAVKNWDSIEHPISGNDTSTLYSGDVVGSITNSNWNPYSASVTAGSGTEGTVELDFDKLDIEDDVIDLAVTVSYLSSAARLGYIYLNTQLGLPTIEIYYIAEPQ